MYIHAFALRWRPDADESRKRQARAEIRGFQGKIEGLLETYIGTNSSPRGQGHELGCVMKFTDRAAYEAYQIHPEHVKLVAWLMLLAEPIEIDFEA